MNLKKVIRGAVKDTGKSLGGALDSTFKSWKEKNKYEKRLKEKEWKAIKKAESKARIKKAREEAFRTGGKSKLEKMLEPPKEFRL